MMNRIDILYTSRKGKTRSSLKIFNDIKGISAMQVGKTFYGEDADIMLDFFKNTTIKENNSIGLYNIFIDYEFEENE